MREILEWPNDLGSQIMIVTLWLIILAVVVALAVGLFYLVDSTFLDTQAGHCRVIRKDFKASHYSTVLIYNASTKTHTPITTFHPDAWTLTVERHGQTDDIEVTESEYLKFEINKVFPCLYAKGRISGDFYIKAL